jgi:dimethylargininase
MLVALTRHVSPGIERCELTHVKREPIDVGRAAEQHRAYELALEALGCTILRLAPEPAMPDSVFVEDTALVLDELAIILRPGVASRRAETAGVASALRAYRALASIEDPGTIDGGDILRIGNRFFVGLSGRTNMQAVEQLGALLAPLDYQICPVDLRGCLHLKSAVTQVSGDSVLLNPEWIDRRTFADFAQITVDPDEPFAANALRIGDALVYPSEFVRTRARLDAAGLRVHAVDMSELAKAEGGVTCSSILFEVE